VVVWVDGGWAAAVGAVCGVVPAVGGAVPGRVAGGLVRLVLVGEGGRPCHVRPLRCDSRSGAAAETAVGLEDLLIGAVHRVRRCQDRWFWRMARRIDSAGLRIRLREAAGHAEQRVRLRARYVLWLIEHPDQVVTGRSWRRWRRTMGVRVTAPCPPSQLAALPAARAATLLGGLSGADLAGVFEAVEAGPAARIAAAIGDVAVVASAVEMMDARTAARMLAPVPEQFAVDVLAAMAPAAAAARFPHPRTRPGVAADEPDPGVGPAVSDGTCDGRPSSAAVADCRCGRGADGPRPGHRRRPVATMRHWWDPGHVLAALPDEVAQALLAAIPFPDRARVRWSLERERFRTAAQTAIAAADR